MYLFMLEIPTSYGKSLGTKPVYYITFHSVNRMTWYFEHSYYLGDAHLLSHTLFFKTILLLWNQRTSFRKTTSKTPPFILMAIAPGWDCSSLLIPAWDYSSLLIPSGSGLGLPLELQPGDTLPNSCGRRHFVGSTNPEASTLSEAQTR